MAEHKTEWEELTEGMDKMKTKFKECKTKRQDLKKEEMDLEFSMLKYTKAILKRLKKLEAERQEEQLALVRIEQENALHIKKLEGMVRGELDLVMEKLESAVGQQHNQLIQQREEQILEKEVQIKEKEEQIQEREEQIKERDVQIQQQKQQLQELEEQAEQQMQQIQAYIEEAERQKQRIQIQEDQLQQLKTACTDKGTQLQRMESRVDQILEEMQTQLEDHEQLMECKEEEYNAMERRLKKELSKEQERNNQLTEELEAYQSGAGDHEYYWELRDQLQNEPLLSAIISVDSYEEYIARYSNEDTISFLYGYFKTDIFRMSERQCKILSLFFEHCLRLHNQLYPLSLLQQSVKRGDRYYYDQHEKEECSSVSGEISRVLLPGIVDEQGIIFKDCKAYVMIES